MYSKHVQRTFLIGLLWAVLAALTPVLGGVLDGSTTDWATVRRLSVVSAGAGMAAYWRKHKALLKMPPQWAVITQQGEQVYQGTNPFIDKYKLMEDLIIMLLPSYIHLKNQTKLGAAVLQEFRTMEVARATIVGVEDPAAEAVAYLDCHFKNTPKPIWYANLTQ